MNDLIRRQDAIEALRNNRMLPFGEHPAYNRAMRDSENVIRKLQSAEPEIIRCKDCKWWGREDVFKDGSSMIVCKKGRSADPEGFCHHADVRG